MKNRACILIVILALFQDMAVIGQAITHDLIIEASSGRLRLTTAGAEHFAHLALQCITKEYPNKPGHVMMDSLGVQAPSALHNAFYGCFDWHSAVHGHWMLVRLLKTYPDMAIADEIRSALDHNLSEEKLLQEAAYFRQPGTKTFERTYGWAWLLKLAEELHTWIDTDGSRWRKSLMPLEREIVKRFMTFLPIQTYPIRTGEHPNTAFGLSFAWDYANTTGNILLKDLIELRSRDYFLSDVHCPAGWEPGGSDFLSPCLEEVDLMRRVLPLKDFKEWLSGFLPGIHSDNSHNLFEPAEVSDRSDPKIVHLDGLNLSRAWCFYGISKTISDNTNTARRIEQAARDHLEATLPYIASGDYAGEHWLASFGVYAIGESMNTEN
jgi:hypothetical protein